MLGKENIDFYIFVYRKFWVPVSKKKHSICDRNVCSPSSLVSYQQSKLMFSLLTSFDAFCLLALTLSSFNWLWQDFACSLRFLSFLETLPQLLASIAQNHCLSSPMHEFIYCLAMVILPLFGSRENLQLKRFCRPDRELNPQPLIDWTIGSPWGESLCLPYNTRCGRK